MILRPPYPILFRVLSGITSFLGVVEATPERKPEFPRIGMGGRKYSGCGGSADGGLNEGHKPCVCASTPGALPHP